MGDCSLHGGVGLFTAGGKERMAAQLHTARIL